MEMDASHIVPQIFNENQLYLESLSHQHQSITSSNCVAPLQSDPAVYQYITQQTIMPTHTSPGQQAGPLPQHFFADGVWHPPQPNLITESEQQAQNIQTCVPRVQIPQHPIHEGGYNKTFSQPSQSMSGLRQAASHSNSHEQFASRQFYYEGQMERLSTELPVSSLQPVNTESYLLHNTRRSPLPLHQGQNCSTVLMPGCSEANSFVLGKQNEQFEPVGGQCLDSNASFRPGTSCSSSHNISVIRKLRQRERNHGRTWNPRERVVGKKRQQSLEDDGCNLPPCKQFLSEEKMAARMSNLSIASDNKMSTLEARWLKARGDAKKQLADIESRLSDSESDLESDSEGINDMHHRIEVSKELRTALSQQKGLLPDSIVKSMSSACTQLVLWKPPSSYIDDIITSPSVDDMHHSTSVLPDDTHTMTTEGREMEDIHCNIEKPIALDHTSSPTCTVTHLFDSVDDDMDL